MRRASAPVWRRVTTITAAAVALTLGGGLLTAAQATTTGTVTSCTGGDFWRCARITVNDGSVRGIAWIRAEDYEHYQVDVRDVRLQASTLGVWTTVAQTADKGDWTNGWDQARTTASVCTPATTYRLLGTASWRANGTTTTRPFTVTTNSGGC